MLSLKQQVYDTLLRRILSGDIVPGEEVNRRTLAAEMGFSVAPVLEAILILEAQGLVETLARKGTRVRIQREQDALGNYLVREALECQLARQVYGRLLTDHYEALAPLALAIDRFETVTKNTLWKAEVAFHCAVADLLDSSTFSSVFRTAICADMFYKLRYLLPHPEHDNRNSHIALLNCLMQASTPDDAEWIVRNNLRNGLAKRFVQRLDGQLAMQERGPGETLDEAAFRVSNTYGEHRN